MKVITNKSTNRTPEGVAETLQRIYGKLSDGIHNPHFLKVPLFESILTQHEEIQIMEVSFVQFLYL